MERHWKAIKRICPAGAGLACRGMREVGIVRTKKSRRTWFARATAVARRQVPANFASCCGKPAGTDQLQYMLEYAIGDDCQGENLFFEKIF